MQVLVSLALPAAVLLLLGACTRSPQAVVRTPAPTAVAPAFVTGPAEEVVPQMIAAEREASQAGDLALLAQLWAVDAQVVDSRGTENADDDFIWPNRSAILDRYEVAVFPAPPPALEQTPSPAITVEGAGAEAVNGQDRWRFVNRGGRWWIAELRY